MNNLQYPYYSVKSILASAVENPDSGHYSIFIDSATNRLSVKDWNGVTTLANDSLYTANGIIGSNRNATLTDTLSFVGGRVSFDSTTNGILLPRMTTAEMNAIVSPATHLLVYNTDLNGLYRYNGSAWVALSAGYGIIGVYSGSGNGTPTFFADLQSALETCKASGGYFTVKLYSNLTITSAIEIDYANTGVGNAYLFRQLTIDFNGFSVTNAQANTSNAFTINLSNSISVYQEVRFVNGNVFRTNGTGTHFGLFVDGYGTIQMEKMYWYCQNGFAASISLNASTNVDANKINDLGGSTFISINQGALRVVDSGTHVTNFKSQSNSSTHAAVNLQNSREMSNFVAINTSSSTGLNISGSNSNVFNFSIFTNSGTGVTISTGTIDNFAIFSTSGEGINALNSNATINNFFIKTGDNRGIYYQGSGGNISNGKVINNSSVQAVFIQNAFSAHNVEGINEGSGSGIDLRSNSTNNSMISNCKGMSVGGRGGYVNASSTGRINVDKCYFISRWNNAGGNGVWVEGTGTIYITNSHFEVVNASANAIYATSTVTVRARFCTHNEVATTPFNSNVTVIQSKSIPDEGIPNVTTAQMNAIVSPATNLLVYNTDLNGLYRYNGSSWVALSSGYGIIGVYSGSGNGTPTFFADLQSALETCKASGGYFTVKLYSNLTITSSINIDYAGSGVGSAYLFRQLTIDFNGFSVTNAQADTSNAFTISLSNNVAVYQEIRFINGTVLRTNGTSTHHALKCDTINRYGTIQMSKMYWYCQNNHAARIGVRLSTAANAGKVCDLGGSVFVSNGTQRTLGLVNSEQTVTNFSCISTTSLAALYLEKGVAQNFYAENTSTGEAILQIGGIANNFISKSNGGISLDISGAEAHNFVARSTGTNATAVFVKSSGLITNFKCDAVDSHALQVDSSGVAINGFCQNNSNTRATIQTSSHNRMDNIEGINLGASFGGRIQGGNLTKCKFISVGGIGAQLYSWGPYPPAGLTAEGCTFESRLNTSGGHSCQVVPISAGVFLLTNCYFLVTNSGANAINATSAVTVRSRYCTHNEVATTPVNANVTIVSSGIIS